MTPSAVRAEGLSFATLAEATGRETFEEPELGVTELAAQLVAAPTSAIVTVRRTKQSNTSSLSSAARACPLRVYSSTARRCEGLVPDPAQKISRAGISQALVRPGVAGPIVQNSLTPHHGWRGYSCPEREQSEAPTETESTPEPTAGPSTSSTEGSPARRELTAEACEKSGRTVVGDIGDRVSHPSREHHGMLQRTYRFGPVPPCADARERDAGRTQKGAEIVLTRRLV
jgi:hypothetical protein